MGLGSVGCGDQPVDSQFTITMQCLAVHGPLSLRHCGYYMIKSMIIGHVCLYSASDVVMSITVICGT